MGLHQNLMDIVSVLYNDEELLRLLYYPSANLAKNIPDPLSTSLPNILEMDEEKQWEIRDDRISFSSKTNDLPPDKPFCRIYVYAGRRRAVSNYLNADQEIRIGIYCHNDWENGDFRSARISDRLNKILVAERITGIGKVNYTQGYPLNSPAEYVAFEHVYEIGAYKK
jgi:hypothetical protein